MDKSYGSLRNGVRRTMNKNINECDNCSENELTTILIKFPFTYSYKLEECENIYMNEEKFLCFSCIQKEAEMLSES